MVSTIKARFCVGCATRVFPISVRNSQTLRRVKDRFYCFSCDELVEVRLQSEVEKLKEKIFKLDKWVYKIPIMIRDLNADNKEFVMSELDKLARVGDTKDDTIIKQERKVENPKGLKQKMPNYIFRENPKPTTYGKRMRDKMLEYIKDNPLCKRKDIQEYLSVSNQSVIMYADEFIDLKMIKGLKNNNSWYYYDCREDDFEMRERLGKIREKRDKEIKEKKRARIKKYYNKNYKRKTTRGVVFRKDKGKAIRLKEQLGEMRDEELVDMDSWLKNLSEDEKEKMIKRLDLGDNNGK